MTIQYHPAARHDRGWLVCYLPAGQAAMHSISSLVSMAERMMLCRYTLLRETPALQLQVVHLKEVMPAALDFDPSDLLACHSHEKCCLPRSSTASSDVRGVPMSAEQNKAVVRHVVDE